MNATIELKGKYIESTCASCGQMMLLEVGDGCPDEKAVGLARLCVCNTCHDQRNPMKSPVINRDYSTPPGDYRAPYKD